MSYFYINDDSYFGGKAIFKDGAVSKTLDIKIEGDNIEIHLDIDDVRKLCDYLRCRSD